MTVRIYTRASTKEQDTHRVLDELITFSKQFTDVYTLYSENVTGTQLERPDLNRLLSEAAKGDILLVESVDRLTRLKAEDFDTLKSRIKAKGLRLVVMDLPTTHQNLAGDDITHSILNQINNLLIDLLATMARLDNDKRKERIKQGLIRSGYKPSGKKADTAKHRRIVELANSKTMSKDEIAKAVGVGVATVYRVLKNDR
jgi:DNA invertase Pin-like site-specific DNA recombinase